MAFVKPPQKLIDAFTAAVPPGAERKKMFGYDAAFVHGNAFVCCWKDGINVKLGPDGRAMVLEGDAVPFEPTPGKAMGGWYLLPERIWSDPDALRDRVRRAHTFVSSLPAKKPKPD